MNVIEFRKWASSIREDVCSLSADTECRYRDPVHWEHYVQTGELFTRLLPEKVPLARAGFLHGVWETQLVRSLKLGDEVEAILSSRKQLWSIDKLDEDVPERLNMEVLPTTLQAEGALLLVVEQILHLDRWRALDEYTERARLRPERLSGPVESVKTAFPNLDTQLAYMRRVVIPTAEYFGLWRYRNWAENICLYYGDRERFLALQEFVLASVRSGVPEQRAEWIRGLLQHRPDVQVAWEWHHLDSLNRKLGGSAAGTWGSRLSRCGRVTVVCPVDKDCYGVLGDLHLAPGTQHIAETEDLIGMARASGYQAIHSTIWRERESDASAERVRVRILSRAMQEERSGVISTRRIASMQRQIEGRRVGDLQVFANDGRAVALPAGSVVLNFACAIHGDFVALAREAMVNRETVDLLHPLREGDVVNLLIGTEPQELPKGWKTKVPLSTQKRIERKFKEVYQPHQIALGRKLLRQKLGARGMKGALGSTSMEDRMLDSFIEDAIASLKASKVGRPLSLPGGVAEFLRNLGGQGGLGPENEETALLVNEIALLVKNAGTAGMEDLYLPNAMVGEFDSVHLCETCQPTPDKTVVGVLQKRRLVIHHAQRKCGVGGTPIVWRRRYSRGQYLVLEMTNRQGIAAEILKRVAARGIDLQDHVGSALGTGWAVLRLHVNALPAEAIGGVIRDLREVPGVLRVLPPGSDIVQALEGSLPPRERKPLASHVSPYLCGPVVTDDRYFYGRGGELAELRKVFDLVEGSRGSRGIHAFVCGPLKTGKTSLVERYLREIFGSRPHCLVAKVQVESRDPKAPQFAGEGWLSVAGRLRDQLLINMGRPLRQIMLAGGQGGGSLVDLLRSIRSAVQSEIVLVIDEAVRTFLASEGRPDLAHLLNFFDTVASVPGLMVIWIGPEAPIEDVQGELSLALRTAEWIRVRPLVQDDVNKLLLAHNLEGAGAQIEVEERIGEELRRFTGGNAYWCNLVANEMFHQAETGRGGAKLYTYETFSLACDHVIERGDGMSDRIADLARGSKLFGIVKVLLRRLAEVDSNRAEVSDSDLHRTAIQSGFQIEEDQLRMVLERLCAQGSIRRESVYGTTQWKIDCPALRQYIARWLLGNRGRI